MEHKVNIAVENTDGIVIVSFDSPSVGSLYGLDNVTERLHDYLNENKPQKVIVDFAGVGFFSSQMLGILVDLWRRLKDYGAVFVISGVSPQLMRVFKVTNLNTIFEFHSDRDSALQALRTREL